MINGTIANSAKIVFVLAWKLTKFSDSWAIAFVLDVENLSKSSFVA